MRDAFEELFAGRAFLGNKVELCSGLKKGCSMTGKEYYQWTNRVLAALWVLAPIVFVAWFLLP